MRRRTVIIVAVGFCCSFACRQADVLPPPEGIEEFGLEESARDHPVVGSAIEAAQGLLSSAAGVAFVPGWKQRGPIGVVPVFAATGSGLSQGEIMGTYSECRCVIVQAGALATWLSRHQGSGDSLLSIDVGSLITYMLLHEVGHVVRGAAFTGKISGSARGPERDQQSDKNAETAADEFAASMISIALGEKGSNRGVSAARVALTLSQLSWNLSAHRLLDDFGGTAIRKRSLFQDAGLSHPNLEWRILKANALISNTAATRQLLDEFENARKAGSIYHLIPQ